MTPCPSLGLEMLMRLFKLFKTVPNTNLWKAQGNIRPKSGSLCGECQGDGFRRLFSRKWCTFRQSQFTKLDAQLMSNYFFFINEHRFVLRFVTRYKNVLGLGWAASYAVEILPDIF